MMTHEKRPTLDDVLNEFVAEHNQPTGDALEKWARRYPQYRRELIDFAAAWAEQLVLPPAPELSVEEEKVLVDRAMSHVLNIAVGRDEQAKALEQNEQSINSLTGEAKNAGFSAQDFAKACGLDLALITKLNNRQIRPRTIPPRLVNHMASLLKRPAAAVVEYLACPPQALAGKAFLSHGKPQDAGQQSFAAAVRASSLSDAEKARWLDEAAGLEES